MGSKKKKHFRQAALDFTGTTSHSEPAGQARRNASPQAAAGPSHGRGQGSSPRSPGTFVGVLIPPSPRKAGLSPKKGKSSGVSSPTKQLILGDYQPDPPSSKAADRATSKSATPASKGPSIQLRFGPGSLDIANMRKPSKATQVQDAKAGKQDRKTKKSPGKARPRRGSMDLDMSGEELDSEAEGGRAAARKVALQAPSEVNSDDVQVPRQTRGGASAPPKKDAKGKGKATAVAVEDEDDSHDSLPSVTFTAGPSAPSGKRARAQSTSSSDNAPIRSPEKKARRERQARMEKAAFKRRPRPARATAMNGRKRGKAAVRESSDEEESESEFGSEGYASPSQYRRILSQDLRREAPPASGDEQSPASVDDSSEVDEDDLFLSDVSEVQTRLRERKHDASGQKFAKLRKAREARQKRDEKSREVRSSRIVPDTDSEGETSPSKKRKGSSPAQRIEVSESSSEEDEEEEEDEEYNSEDFIVDDVEGLDVAKTRKMVEELMPQHFRGASKQTKIYHFKVTCQFLIHAILMPQINWLETSKDFAYSANRLFGHFAGLATSLVSSSVWTAAFTKALDRRPLLELEHIESEPGCEACNNQSKISTYLLRFSGSAYNRENMQDLPPPDSDDEGGSSYESSEDSSIEEIKTWQDEAYRCGQFCALRAETYHGLKHWQYETHVTLLGAVEKYRSMEPASPSKKKLSESKVNALRQEADRLTELVDKKGLVQQLWDDFRQRERTANHTYGGS